MKNKLKNTVAAITVSLGLVGQVQADTSKKVFKCFRNDTVQGLNGQPAYGDISEEDSDKDFTEEQIRFIKNLPEPIPLEGSFPHNNASYTCIEVEKEDSSGTGDLHA